MNHLSNLIVLIIFHWCQCSLSPTSYRSQQYSDIINKDDGITIITDNNNIDTNNGGSSDQNELSFRDWFDTESLLGTKPLDKFIYYGGQTKGGGGGGINLGDSTNTKKCYAISVTANDFWCTTNCARGFCPKSHCQCSGGGLLGNALTGSSWNEDNGSNYINNNNGYQQSQQQQNRDITHNNNNNQWNSILKKNTKWYQSKGHQSNLINDGQYFSQQPLQVTDSKYHIQQQQQQQHKNGWQNNYQTSSSSNNYHQNYN